VLPNNGDRANSRFTYRTRRTKSKNGARSAFISPAGRLPTPVPRPLSSTRNPFSPRVQDAWVGEVRTGGHSLERPLRRGDEERRHRRESGRARAARGDSSGSIRCLGARRAQPPPLVRADCRSPCPLVANGGCVGLFHLELAGWSQSLSEEPPAPSLRSPFLRSLQGRYEGTRRPTRGTTRGRRYG
jgi:hypothetical protein